MQWLPEPISCHSRIYACRNGCSALALASTQLMTPINQAYSVTFRFGQDWDLACAAHPTKTIVNPRSLDLPSIGALVRSIMPAWASQSNKLGWMPPKQVTVTPSMSSLIPILCDIAQIQMKPSWVISHSNAMSVRHARARQENLLDSPVQSLTCQHLNLPLTNSF